MTSSKRSRATNTEMFKGQEDAIKGYLYDIVNPSTSVGVTPPTRPVPGTGTATIDPLDM